MNVSLSKVSADQPLIRTLDRVSASLLALCPVLQHYRAPFYNAAVMVMAVVVVYLVCRMALMRKELCWKNLKTVAVLMVYMVFRIVDHGTSVTELGRSAVLIVFFAAAALDCIDLKWMCRTALVVACIASVALVIQYISFFLFDHHLQMVPVSLLLPSADQWILGAQTGLASISGVIREDGFYRPSAFFLEPSHVYIYLFPHLLMVLLGEKQNLKQKAVAILLSLGLIQCTSSFGIVAVCAAWGLFFGFYDERTNTFTVRNLFRRRTLILLGIALVAFVAAVIAVPRLQRIVVRIFYNDPGKSTAIGGRIADALEGLKELTPKQWLLGVADTTRGLPYNMPGIIGALRSHGIFAMVLSMEFYVKSTWKLKMPFWPVALMVVGTSFFSAHTHSAAGMMYYVLILLLGYQTSKRTESLWTDLRADIAKKN